MSRKLIALLLIASWGALTPRAYGSALPPGVEVGGEPVDAYLAGVLDGILYRELGWPRDSYRIAVYDAVATVTVYADYRERRREMKHLQIPEGLQSIEVVRGVREPLSPVREEVYSFLGLEPETVPFPVGDLFRPLIADPKQAQFFVSFRYYEAPGETTNVAAVGYGETFGFFRRPGRRPGNGLQLSLSGALFAQFNLDAPSDDLVNADYTIGIPLTYRYDNFSARLRFYHQSSHLGDEFLLSAQPDRVNLSYESVEMLFSYSWKQWRAYAGGEYLVNREPADLRPESRHAGVEYRGDTPSFGGGYWIGGIDLKNWREHDWAVDASVKAGLEFGAALPGRRRVRIMLEAYDGFAPHGQFYNDPLRYTGIGVYLGF